MTNRDIAFSIMPDVLPQSFRLEAVDFIEKELDKAELRGFNKAKEKAAKIVFNPTTEVGSLYLASKIKSLQPDLEGEK